MRIDQDVTDVTIDAAGRQLQAWLGIPEHPRGTIVFAHGSGSGRMSPRNNHVARALRKAGFATLLLDLLTEIEERDRRNVFDIRLLANRLILAANWVSQLPQLGRLPIGYFGASTGAGAALVAAAFGGKNISAVVSRGGRPDLAGDMLGAVIAPTLLIVGSEDGPVISLNQQAYERLGGVKEMVIIDGAGHLFEEPGTLDEVISHATRWFKAHVKTEAEA